MKKKKNAKQRIIQKAKKKKRQDLHLKKPGKWTKINENLIGTDHVTSFKAETHWNQWVNTVFFTFHQFCIVQYYDSIFFF